MKTSLKLILFLCLIIVKSTAYSQSILDDFNATIKGYPNLQSVDIQSDGKIIVGGRITMVGDKFVEKVVRLSSDGSLDESFSTTDILPYDLFGLVSGFEDKVLIMYNGTNQNNMRLLNSDGSNDENFEYDQRILNVQTAYALDDGFLLFCFLQGFGDAIIKVDMAGTLDETFQPALVSGFVSKIGITSTEKIIIAGTITTINNQTVNNIAILNSNGTLSSSFINTFNTDSEIQGFDIDQNDQILFHGFERQPNSIDERVIKLKSDGSVDESFSDETLKSSINGSIEDIRVTDDGFLIAGVHSDQFFFGKRIIKINNNGSLNDDFEIISLDSRSGSSFIKMTTFENDIFTYGFFSSINETNRIDFAKFNSLTGLVDNLFDPRIGNSPTINSAIEQSDGKILIAGEFYEVNGEATVSITRLNDNGSLDLTFDPNFDTRPLSINTMGIQSDGKIILAGFLGTEELNQQHIIRLNQDGSFDESFSPAFGQDTNSIIVLDNDKIIIAGGFSFVDVSPRNHLAKLNSDGSLDESFNSSNHIVFDQMIKTMHLQNDGRILLGGHTNYTNGLVLRLDENGIIDDTFNSPMNLDFFINTLAVSSNNTIIGGGLTFQGATISPLYQFSQDGLLKDPISINIGEPKLNSSINYTDAMFISEDEMILSGSFQMINGENRIGIAKTNLDGVVDSNFNFSVDAFSPILLNTGNSSIFVFGDFQKVNEKRHHGAVKIKYVNDIPEIIGLSRTIEINEDEVYEFDATDLLVVDIDDIYPDVFDINIIEGNSYTVDGNKIIPKADFFGELLVTFEVIDSKGASDQLTSTINVLPINDLPVINDQIDISIDEDAAVLLSLDMLQISDPDNTYPDDFTLAILAGDNYTFDGLTVTPNQDFDEELSINVVVNDGTDDSEAFELAIDINPINDPPIILEQSEVLLLNLFKGVDASTRKFEIPLGILEISDPDNSNTDFTGIILEGQGYTVENNKFFVSDNAAAQFNVSFKVNDGNLDSEQFDVAVELQVVSSLEDTLEKSITIYPNPASDRLIFSINEYQTKSLGISISDISGRIFYATLRENISNTFNEQIDISRLPIGLYMLTLKSETDIVNQKFLKK